MESLALFGNYFCSDQILLFGFTFNYQIKKIALTVIKLSINCTFQTKLFCIIPLVLPIYQRVVFRLSHPFDQNSLLNFTNLESF